MLKRWRHILALFVSLFALVFAAAMFDPFFRQLTFGPKYDGIPLVTWQAFFREWDVMDSPKAQRPLTYLEIAHESIIATPNPGHWKRLSGEDRRAILLTLTDEKEEINRMHVAKHLGEVPASPEVVAVLKRYLHDPGARVRQYAVSSVVQLDPAPLELFPAVLELINDSDIRVSENAVYSVRLFTGKSPDTTMPLILPRLKAAEVDVRLQALRVVSAAHPPTRQAAIDAIMENVKHTNPDVRRAAVATLGIVPREVGMPAIIVALNDPDHYVRWSAAYGIKDMGPSAKSAVPALIDRLEFLHEQRERVGYNIPEILALGGIGKDAKDAIPQLVRFLEHESQVVRKDAQEALSQIDPKRFPPKNAK